MWNVMYCDDISLVCTDADSLSTVVSIMDTLSITWRQAIADSIQKMKVLVVGRDSQAQAFKAVVTVSRDNLEVMMNTLAVCSRLTAYWMLK